MNVPYTTKKFYLMNSRLNRDFQRLTSFHTESSRTTANSKARFVQKLHLQSNKNHSGKLASQSDFYAFCHSHLNNGQYSH